MSSIVGYAQWSPYAYYELNDIVDYDAASWVCLNGPNIDKQPDASPTFWSQIGGGGGVITTINAGTGITVTGAGVSRTIATNLSAADARLTITPSTGTQLVLTNTCPASVVAGGGINITGTNATGRTVALGTVGTAGGYLNPTSVTTDVYGRVTAITAGSAPVTSVSAGPGISIGGSTTNPTINNTGVLSVSNGSGISIGGTTSNPTIVNTGVLGLTSSNAGAGITIGGSSTVPLISNSGVRTITAGSGITLGGTAQNPVINATAASSVPLMSRTLFNSTQPAFPIGPTASGNITSTLNGVIVNHINNGTAFPNNVWVLDFSALVIRWDGAWNSADGIQFSFTDGVNTYTPTGPTQAVVRLQTPVGNVLDLGQVSFNPNTLKALGFNGAQTVLRLTNNSPASNIYLLCVPSVGYATYYPSGY